MGFGTYLKGVKECECVVGRGREIPKEGRAGRARSLGTWHGGGGEIPRDLFPGARSRVAEIPRTPVPT